jgi:Pvc16 N-terminal domain
MSNYLAIATVTATLQRILQASVQRDVDGVRVTAVKPGMIGAGTPELGVNLFLYHVSRNPAISPDMAASRLKSSGSRRQTPLELYYMLSFYGNDTELEPHRLLGSVVRTFSDRTTLTPEMIRDTIADSSFTFLEVSDLADQIQQLMISPVDMTVEDLSKVWSVFFQAPYLLSMAYKVTAIMIDGEDLGKRALPVRDRSFKGILPFATYPVVEQVIHQAGMLEPILSDSTILIRGKQLKGMQTSVRLGTTEVPITDSMEMSETQIALSLGLINPTLLRAGVQDLQIIHRVQDGDRQRQAESNVLPFVLRPTVKTIQVLEQSGRGDDLRSAELSVLVNLPVGAGQRVRLLLNEWSVDQPKIYVFFAPARQEDTDRLTISIQDIQAGEYLVRLQIDGADSLLDVDTQADSPTFNWYHSPKILIE